MRQWKSWLGIALLAALGASVRPAMGQALTYWNEPENQIAIAAQVDYLNWNRTPGFADVGLVSRTPPAAPILGTGDIGLPNADGLRVTVGLPITQSWLAEFSYFSLNSVTRTATVGSPTGPDDLFSIFSGFGDVPVVGVGFAETDQARQAALSYTSQIESYELNARRVMLVEEGPLTWSLLAGLRHIKLQEASTFSIDAPLNAAGMTYRVNTGNSLVGFQGGSECWLNIHDYVSTGALLKMGVLVNQADQQSTITATSLAVPLEEEADSSLAAFMLELNLMTRVRMSDNITLRMGYQMLLIDNVAVAPGNFDFRPPFLAPGFVNPPRTPGIVDDTSVLYHGLSAGVEVMW